MVTGFERAARIDEIFSRRGRIAAMLVFEAGLGRALAKAGVTTSDVADAIASCCAIDRFDVDRIARDSVSAGNDAIPLIEQLRARVAESSAAAADFVHWGATSQDVIDSATMLQLREALALYDSELRRLVLSLADLAEAESATPMVARTLLQHALPTTFGFKAALWLDGVHRAASRLHALRNSAVVLQFGGAVGTLAALGDKGPAVAAALSSELGLPTPEAPWHTTRDRIAEIAAGIGVLTGMLGKIARDVSLLSQSEIAELHEASSDGRGRSSTMPHKHNPVGCAAIVSTAIRMPGLVATILSGMVQEHERALGGWQSEWETVPEICTLGYSALATSTFVISGLQIDRDRMASNLDATKGAIFAEALTFALAPRVGREAARTLAQRALQRARNEARYLRDVLVGDQDVAAHLSTADVAKLFDPRNYIGAATDVTRRVVDRARRFAAELSEGQ
jgi:3-carboxy-cis,cis-muconate cycloisomerase